MRTRHLAIVAAVLWACDGAGAGTDTAPADPGPGDVPAADTPAEDLSATDEGPVADLPVDTPPADATNDDGPPPASAECLAVAVGGLNTLTVDGMPRRFYLNAPAEATGPGGSWPLVFLWHGYIGANLNGDTQSATFRSLLAGQVGDAAFPFLLVTPLADEVAFLDWNILDIASGDESPDVRLFDEVLACLDARFGVDADHVHSAGFSAGGLMTDLLGVSRGDRMASLLTWSGAYLANAANDTGAYEVYWPDVGPSSGWTQLVFRGGPTDVWEAPGMTANFDTWTQNDLPWLAALGHDVIECVHALGHTPMVSSDFSYAVQFFRDHPRGKTASPWAGGLPASLPPGCLFHPKTP